MAIAKVSPAAERDLDEHADYLAAESVDAAVRFYAAARSTFRFLAANPGAGHRRPFLNPALRDVRSWSVEELRRVSVFYREAGYGIHVIGVVNGARDVEAELDR